MKILNFNLGDGRLLFIRAEHFVSIEDADGGGSIIRHHGGNVDRQMITKCSLGAAEVMSMMFVVATIPGLTDRPAQDDPQARFIASYNGLPSELVAARRTPGPADPNLWAISGINFADSEEAES